MIMIASEKCVVNVILFLGSENNCLCQSASAKYNGGIIETFPLFACEGVSVDIGLEQEDADYSWKQNELITCDSCSANTILVDFNQPIVFLGSNATS